MDLLFSHEALKFKLKRRKKFIKEFYFGDVVHVGCKLKSVKIYPQRLQQEN